MAPHRMETVERWLEAVLLALMDRAAAIAAKAHGGHKPYDPA